MGKKTKQNMNLSPISNFIFNSLFWSHFSFSRSLRSFWREHKIDFLFFSELRYSPIEFNSKKITNIWQIDLMRWNINGPNSLLKWRFRPVAVVIALAP